MVWLIAGPFARHFRGSLFETRIRTETRVMVTSHGHFVWYELVTTDVAAAIAFYTQGHGLGRLGRVDARQALHPVRRREVRNQRADAAAGRCAADGRAADLGRLRRGRRRRRDRRAGRAPRRGGTGAADRRSATSAAFRSSPIRRALGSRCSNGAIPASSRAPRRTHQGVSAGTNCLPPTGSRRGLSTASFSAGRKRTPTSARRPRISPSPPEGR